MDVERQIRNALEARFEKLAPTELKNISVPMDLFRIVLPWEQRTSEIRGQRSEVRKSSVALPASKLLWVAVVVLVALGIGWWWTAQQRRASPLRGAPSAMHATDQKSIAVLPFVNMSADKNDEYLSDGMTEELLNVLT